MHCTVRLALVQVKGYFDRMGITIDRQIDFSKAFSLGAQAAMQVSQDCAAWRHRVHKTWLYRAGSHT